MKILKKIVCGLIMAIAMAFHGVSGAEAEPLQMPVVLKLKANKAVQEIRNLMASELTLNELGEKIKEITDEEPLPNDIELTKYLIELLIRESQAPAFITGRRLADKPTARETIWMTAAALLNTPTSIDLLKEYISKNVQIMAIAQGMLIATARRGGALNIIDSLLQAGVSNVNPALLEAVRSGHTDIVKRLLLAGADPNTTKDNKPLLFFAGNLDIFHLLLAQGANPNVISPETGNTLLMDTVMQVNEKKNVVRHILYLLQAGADVNAVLNGKTALDLATDQRVKELLWRYGARSAKDFE